MTSSSRLEVDSMQALAGDLAGTYRRSGPIAAPGAVPSDVLEADLAALERDGFVVLERLVSAADAARVRDALLPLLGPTGRNGFEGFRTQRAYALLAKTRSVDALVAHPRILAILAAALDPDPLLSACLAIRILPGEEAQAAHYDDAFYPDPPRPRATHALSVVWALDDFTGTNGATTFWPGSHRWDAEREPRADESPRTAVMPAGSALVFSGELWHGGGANRSAAPRLAVTPQYCKPWLRTQENMSLAVPPSVVAGLSAPLQRLLGYEIRPPFMGHVDGLHPRRLLAPG